MNVGEKFGHLTVTAMYQEETGKRRKYVEYECSCGYKGKSDDYSFKQRKKYHCGCGGFSPGDKFGKLTVERIYFEERNGKNVRRADCVCECGGKHNADFQEVKRGSVKSCGCLAGNKYEEAKVGDTYSRLTIESITVRKSGKNNKKYAECICSCGNKAEVPMNNLKSGKTKSCGCLISEKTTERNLKHGLSEHPLYTVWLGLKRRGVVCEDWQDFVNFKEWCEENGWEKGVPIRRIDVDKGYFPSNCTCEKIEKKEKIPKEPLYTIGEKYNRLTLLELYKKNNNTWGKFECECGNIHHARASAVKSGGTMSCGCYRKEMKGELRTTHGMSGERIYRIWAGMLSRCRDTSHPRYGGRGISVCKEWETFENFYEWAKDKYQEHLQIDRINNNGGYEPSNCRFVNSKTQANNKENNVNITAFGETKTLSAWQEDERSQVKDGQIKQRIENGMTPEEAIITPPKNLLKIKIGDVYGKLEVIYIVQKERGRSYGVCRCKCGNIKHIISDSLIKGGTKTCGECRDENPGDKFHNLTIQETYYKESNGQKHRWAKCMCDCGNIHHAQISEMKRGNVKSCGCIRKLDVKPGDVFHGLEIIETYMKKSGNQNNTYAKFKCVCGKIHDTLLSGIVNGRTKSCGCIKARKAGERCQELSFKHGKSNHPLYGVWAGIKNRCKEQNVSLCKEWEDFEVFYNWAMENDWEKRLNIYRIDTSQDYSPSNCKIGTAKERANSASYNIKIEAFGETKTIMDWESDDRCVVPANNIYERIKTLGWTDMEKVLTKPVRKIQQNTLKPGDKINKLKIIEIRRKKISGNWHTVALSECECGNRLEIKCCSISSGNTKSCGCLRRKA